MCFAINPRQVGWPPDHASRHSFTILPDYRVLGRFLRAGLTAHRMQRLRIFNFEQLPQSSVSGQTMPFSYKASKNGCGRSLKCFAKSKFQCRTTSLVGDHLSRLMGSNKPALWNVKEVITLTQQT